MFLLKQDGYMNRKFKTNIVRPFWAVGRIGDSCVAAYKAKGATSQANSYINLANPGTHDAMAVVAPSWSEALGWVFNGSTQALGTDIIPSSGWTMLVCYNTLASVGVAAIIAGSQNTTGNRRFYVGKSAAGAELYGSGALAIDGAVTSSGVLTIAGQNGYFNGVSRGLSITDWDTPTNARPIYFGAVNVDGSAASFASVRIFAVAIYDTILSTRQIQGVTTNMLEL